MPYAASFIDALTNRPLSAGFIDNFIMANKLTSVMPFNKGGATNGKAGFSAVIVRNAPVTGSMGSRAWGSDYPIVNSNPIPEIFWLKVFGGGFSIDFTQNAIADDILAANEMKEKMSFGINEYARQFIKGDAVANPNEFTGLQKYCTDNSLVYPTNIDISGVMTDAIANNFYSNYNDAASVMNVDANFIVASKVLEAKLVTINSLVQKYNTPVQIGKCNYNQFFGVPIIPLPNSIGLRRVVGADTLEDGYIIRLDEEDGVFTLIPDDAADFIRTQKPVQIGKPNGNGFAEFVGCLIPKNQLGVVKFSAKVA